MLIRRAEIEGRCRDLRLDGGLIGELADRIAARPGEAWIDARGGALLPGLCDHHIHLLALAAALRSVACGPPRVRTAEGLARALAEAARGPAGGSRSGWLRGVGYCESVAGPLGRVELDRLVPDRPLRVQHRSGALWMLNSAGIAALGLDSGRDAPGVERDGRGRASGRLFRCDEALRRWLTDAAATDLSAVGELLLRRGVVGVTDATPHNGPEELALLAGAVAGGALPQRLRVMGRRDLPEAGVPRVQRGEVKLVLREDALPALDALADEIRGAHAAGREVAIHCVTRAELVLAAAALAQAGARRGDRIEHAAVAPPDAVALLAELPLTVVTQPHFLRERGDDYLADVEPRDRCWLYRGSGLLAAGLGLAGGSDAPYGEADPWAAMRAAVERRSESGVSLSPAEALSPERALALFTSALEDPGGAPRRLEPGARADLCLLARPWAEAREELSASQVRATLCGGELAFAHPDLDLPRGPRGTRRRVQ